MAEKKGREIVRSEERHLRFVVIGAGRAGILSALRGSPRTFVGDTASRPVTRSGSTSNADRRWRCRSSRPTSLRRDDPVGRPAILAGPIYLEPRGVSRDFPSRAPDRDTSRPRTCSASATPSRTICAAGRIPPSRDSIGPGPRRRLARRENSSPIATRPFEASKGGPEAVVNAEAEGDVVGGIAPQLKLVAARKLP